MKILFKYIILINYTQLTTQFAEQLKVKCIYSQLNSEITGIIVWGEKHEPITHF